VGAKAAHLPKIAQKAPRSAKVASREKQIKRFLANPKIVPADYFAPFARLLLQSFSHSRLVLAIDGSVTVTRLPISITQGKATVSPPAPSARNCFQGYGPSCGDTSRATTLHPYFYICRAYGRA